MIEVYTLIDITHTKIHRNVRPQGSSYSTDQWDFLRNQQRNWDTILQLLGLRFQPMDVVNPVCLENQHGKDYTFGSRYTTQENLKIWKCGCSYDHKVDVELLKADFDNIPIITNLGESVKLTSPFILTSGEKCNLLLFQK